MDMDGVIFLIIEIAAPDTAAPYNSKQQPNLNSNQRGRTRECARQPRRVCLTSEGGGRQQSFTQAASNELKLAEGG